jgi:hypothetical protein
LLGLPGCAVKLHGLQTAGGGTEVTALSVRVSASARISGAELGFSSGQVPAPSAPGGHLALGKGTSAVLVLGLVLADAASWLGAKLRGEAAPQPAAAGGSIAHTCSCYQRHD